MVESSKTQRIIELLAADIPKGMIMAQVGCSQNLVYKTLNRYTAEIATLKTKYKSQSKPQPSAPAPCPVASPTFNVPTLDPAKPAAPQLEAMAWSIIAQAAAGGDVTNKQATAAREIIKNALRDKVPPPVDRKFTFKLDVIDVVAGAFVPVSTATYEVKP